MVLLKNTKNLAGLQIRADEEFSFEMRKTRHLIDKGYAGHYMIKNIQLGAEGDSMDICVCGMVPKVWRKSVSKEQEMRHLVT
jgi:hypothetical protein